MLIPNTFNVKAHCANFVEFTSVKQLLDNLGGIREALHSDSLLIIGRGSNLLPVKDYEGTVVRSQIMGRDIIADDGETVLLRCGSGETVDEVIAWAVGEGLYGMENLSLIPGEVGASAVQNIGAYGVEAKDVIESVEAIEIESGETVRFSNADCQYAYRQSRFKGEWKNRYIITFVTYRLSRSFVAHLDYGNINAVLAERGITTPTAQQLRDVIIDIRNAKLPDYKVIGNAGSFFMNPIVSQKKYEELAAEYEGMPHYSVDSDRVKIPAGWLIEQCGWKGRRVGNVGVHDKQALVLVNHGNAEGSEVVELCRSIQQDVLRKFGININPEVNIV